MNYYYPLIAMPLAILGLPLYIYLPTYYAVDLNINITLVGVVLFLARLSDVFSDPLIGFLSDKSQRVLNSKKPIMFIGFLLATFSFYALINPIKEYALYFLIFFSILIYLGFSMIMVPYLTWVSEISDDYNEISSLNSNRELFTIIGLVLALIAPTMIDSQQLSQKLNLLFLLFIFLFTPLFLITLLKMKTKFTNNQTEIKLSILKLLYKEKEDYKYLQIGYFFNSLANAIPATLFILFIQVVIQDKNSNEWILIVYFLAGIIALPFWNKLSKSKGKKQVWVLSILLASISFFFVVFLKQGDILWFALISFVTGLSLGADIAFPTAIQSDIIQNSKYKQLSSTSFGIWTMLTKLALASSVMITFSILGLIGFDENNINQNMILTLSLLYALLPVILKLFSLYFILKFKERRK
ncbi:MFS transporter [Arcobacter arenosus]|uniref:MFS transporter n=1 Tax=Arcobacter arenosus TaxID=2576037 RepID=A0A5R8Y079_9BACT|nr:MFS transporter [Arcobacter arenosus]TLP37483.1 MFS transporter [Arcobacter arenosus]